MKQTTLKVEQRKKTKKEHPLTPAERQKLERQKLIKNQLAIFSKCYPELVEKNSIKYPIDDQLILKLPELHGVFSEKDNSKPKPYKILVNSEEFEQLLYIWEFCNNFAEFLEVPEFTLEELRLALSFTEQEFD